MLLILHHTFGHVSTPRLPLAAQDLSEHLYVFGSDLEAEVVDVVDVDCVGSWGHCEEHGQRPQTDYSCAFHFVFLIVILILVDYKHMWMNI